MGPRRFDAVVILVKSQATEAAFASIRPALEGRPVLVTLQNGMGNEEVLARVSDLDVAHGVSFEAAECIRVAEALGIRLEFDPMYLVKKIRAGESPLTQHAGSMAQDIEAGRETELEAMTGYVVRKAKELGVPVTESVYGMAKGVEYAVKARRAGA